ncbi:HAD family hydrolase [Palaeococcus pacificus]|uniref:HAD family hydrolase n=1 Tax=Palaeococcus pacificus TaxID=971279 RepID=UPI00064F91DF|nr:HAD family hydrolase [Palaeococcus pacificus]
MRRKIAVIDIEGTLTPFEFWREISRLVGNPKIEELLEKGILGEVEWIDSLLKRVELIKGVDAETFLKPKAKVNPKAEELIRILKEKGFFYSPSERML